MAARQVRQLPPSASTLPRRLLRPGWPTASAVHAPGSRSSRSGKRWTHRRRRLMTQAAVDLGLQTLNSIFYLVPNRWGPRC